MGGAESPALAGINSQVTEEVMRIAELAELCCKASVRAAAGHAGAVVRAAVYFL